MNAPELLGELAGRIPPLWHDILDDLDHDGLTHRAGEGANPIAWLAWHAARVTDDHVAGIADVVQVWPAHAAAFELAVPLADHGYGHGPAEVEEVTRAVAAAGVAPLLAYIDAVAELTITVIARLDDSRLDRIVDDSWDPPVTAGVRFASLLSDNLQHAGQAAYVRGLAERAAGGLGG